MHAVCIFGKGPYQAPVLLARSMCAVLCVVVELRRASKSGWAWLLLSNGPAPPGVQPPVQRLVAFDSRKCVYQPETLGCQPIRRLVCKPSKLSREVVEDVSLGANEGLEIGAFTFSAAERRMNASHTGEKVEASFAALCTE